jgi:hypothetical protein
MWEDMEDECLRTIERGEIDHSFRYSRRHRWKPLDVDIDGDMAVVAVATRGKRQGGGVTARRYRRNGDWHLEAAGGAGDEAPTLRPRPVPGARWFVLDSTGGSQQEQPTRRPKATVQVHDAVILAAEGVAMVERRGRRSPVADHGFVCVVWAGRTFPGIDLLDDEGRRLDRVTERDVQRPQPRLLWHLALRRRLWERSHAGGWFNSDRGRRQ